MGRYDDHDTNFVVSLALETVVCDHFNGNGTVHYIQNLETSPNMAVSTILSGIISVSMRNGSIFVCGLLQMRARSIWVIIFDIRHTLLVLPGDQFCDSTKVFVGMLSVVALVL